MHRLRALLNPLRVFDAVSRSGGVTAAAEVLHVSPAAVTHQIKHLEDMLGVALFRRSGRALTLTDAGSTLAPSVAQTFDRLEKLIDEVTAAPDRRQLRIKVVPSFAIRWLIPRLPSFYEAHPQFDLTISTVGRVEDLNFDNADFVVRYGPKPPAGVKSQRLFRDELVPVCAPKLKRRVRSLKELGHCKLLHSAMREQAWAQWLAGLGMDLPPGGESVMLESSALCIQAAIAGLGVALVQRSYIQDELENGSLVIPFDEAPVSHSAYYLLCEPGKSNLATFKAFREWIVNAV